MTISEPFTVLHVCTGNICRSPLSERIFDHLTSDAVYNHGAGTSAFHEGEDMQSNSARILAERGYDDRRHYSRPLERDSVEISDLILVATDGHREFIADRFPEALDRTMLVRHMGAIAARYGSDVVQRGDGLQDRLKLLLSHADDTDVPAENLADPWGLGRRVYDQIADELETALYPLAKALEPEDVQ
ncbi:low molecular weight phosphatase family protein [Haloglycomyces albus]|uniref:arsenate-mycothiol transferase ArsC n=1 Tax=Haloglycomyces albus TaxID=526067 RepID=UPI00046CED6A|nr:hypothetical protein [Haloglycomyces albus]